MTSKTRLLVESINFFIAAAGTDLDATSMAFHNSSFEVNCRPLAYISRLMMDQQFSIGLKSGEFGGQIIKLLSLNPNEARYCLVALAECEGALSCMNKGKAVDMKYQL